MKLSVIVPLYNKARWIQRTLESIQRQTFTDFEVLVVDDGSSDSGPAQVLAFPDRRIRLIRQLNWGPGAARNRGAAEAQGELLAFLDADDTWQPKFLERSVAALNEAGRTVASVTSGHFVMPGATSREAMWRKRGVREGLLRLRPTDDPIRVMHTLAYMSPCTTVIRRNAFERHGGFYARERCLYGEDAYLFLRVLLHETVLLRTEPLVTFFEDASSLSHNYQRARPIEPFLRFSEEFELHCPIALRPLLRRLLTVRASKTACMLSFWGRRREASQLLRRFSRNRDLFEPWTLAALLASSPLGALAGAFGRTLLSAKNALRAARSPAQLEAIPSVAPAHARIESLTTELLQDAVIDDLSGPQPRPQTAPAPKHGAPKPAAQHGEQPATTPHS